MFEIEHIALSRLPAALHMRGAGDDHGKLGGVSPPLTAGGTGRSIRDGARNT
jgi:hypothetical protein